MINLSTKHKDCYAKLAECATDVVSMISTEQKAPLWESALNSVIVLLFTAKKLNPDTRMRIIINDLKKKDFSDWVRIYFCNNNSRACSSEEVNTLMEVKSLPEQTLEEILCDLETFIDVLKIELREVQYA